MYFSFTFKPIRILIFTLIIIFFALLIVNHRYISVPSNTNDMVFKVVIDPGHGSIDTGTSYGDILEKDINLQIAKYLALELKKANIIPIMTRTEDKLYQDSRNKDIRQRPLIANESKADLFISIHANNFPSSQPSGSQIFYKIDSEESKNLAEFLQKELIKLRKENDRSLKKGDYYVLNKINCPGVLIEVGFLSNSTDRKMLTDPNYQKQLSIAIKDGIIQYFQENFHKINKKNKENEDSEYVNNYNQDSATNSLYYLSMTNNQISLIKNKMTFPTSNFFAEDYSLLSFNEILAISALEQLLDPPSGLLSPLPEGTNINSLQIKDKIATIDLSAEARENFEGGSELELYAVDGIIKTLLSLPEIDGIEILVEGKKEQSLGGHILFDKILYHSLN